MVVVVALVAVQVVHSHAHGHGGIPIVARKRRPERIDSVTSPYSVRFP